MCISVPSNGQGFDLFDLQMLFDDGNYTFV